MLPVHLWTELKYSHSREYYPNEEPKWITIHVCICEYIYIYTYIFMLIYIKPYDDNLLNIFHRWMHIVKTNTPLIYVC